MAVIHFEAVEHGEDLIDHRRIGQEDDKERPGRRLVLELLLLLQPPHTLLHGLGLLVAIERRLDVVIVVLFVLMRLVPPVPPGVIFVLQR